MRLGVPQRRSGRGGEEKNSQPLCNFPSLKIMSSWNENMMCDIISRLNNSAYWIVDMQKLTVVTNGTREYLFTERLLDSG